ncbi:GNAT family N-acetyltransferase [Rhodovarius crocodyli]|uniref:GNAT family N-acetyltransferase n=1 Tax=Rhodovarius crocodyli TaxID=1979269 RepID=A0A437MP76_9PROT|nr:GNAT family N-acetyltransferase [Rhodovarius crocodyli]RVT99448.1 GNAT family N-acetyltransferase [Rhodovarius crocodyli]
MIRRAAPSDLDGMRALYRHLNAEDPVPDNAAAEAAWAALLASPLIRLLIAERDGMPVSSCTLVIIPNLTRGARPYALIENVVTHADYRRQGLGQAVLAAALDTAWEQGCYKVMLATGSKQASTLRFYERAGFVTGEKTFFQARRG